MREHKKDDHKWFIHARRNLSLLHASYLMQGLSGKGWQPTINFWVDDVVVLGFAGKGSFIYLDKNQLSNKDKYKDIQKSIESNFNFIQDFRKRTDEIFGAIDFKSKELEEGELSVLSENQLFNLYKSYLENVLIAPIITVQVYGIEAMIDPDYKIVKEIKKQLKILGRESEFSKYKEIFLTNDGETVAFSERKDFYQICSTLDKPKNLELFEKPLKELEKEIDNYSDVKELIENHIKKYYWVNTEYLGEAWAREKWIDLFKSTLLDRSKRPEEKLSELMTDFKKSIDKKKAAIEELKLQPNVIHSVKVLGEFLAQRDWTKGYMIKSLSGFHKLLDEISKRIKINFDDILQYSYLEIYEYFEKGRKVLPNELRKRSKEGYVIIIKNGKFSLFSGIENIRKIMVEEKIENPLDKISFKSQIEGTVASMGKAEGLVRVIDDPTKIPEFKEGEILVTYMTTIEFTPIFRKAKAIITDEGGMSCHAAIVSREFKLPCIVGTQVGTRVLKTGDRVKVDADNGIVTIIR